MSMENKSTIAEFAAILEDHLKLATLEARYEVQTAIRRLLVFSVLFMLSTAAFLLAQVAIVYGLASLGLAVWQACLVIAAAYAGLGLLLFMRWGRRNPDVGSPFSATRRELGATLRWIQKLFS